MKKGDHLDKVGFTVIEVVLVLAVAGLIFAMAFIAVPALQRTQRDNDRRDDMMKFVTEVKRYQTSNRGNLPTISGSTPINWSSVNGSNVSATSWQGFYKSYLGERFMDPDGTSYSLRIVECGVASADSQCVNGVPTLVSNMENGSFSSNNHTMLVVTRAKCSGNNVLSSSSPRNLAVLYRLEGSGTYCYGT